MKLTEIYNHPDYLLIADQIENHQLAINGLMAELQKRFPSKNRSWVIMGNNRPHLVGADEPEEVEPKKCQDGLLPDGPVCPACGGRRGPSGVDRGTWVHY